jgi:hypothetical protein
MDHMVDPTGAPLPAATAVEAIDPELLALPAPPKGRRLLAMTLMAAVVGLSLGLGASVRTDLAYTLQPDRAAALGDAGQLDPIKLVSNSFARVSGTPMLSGMVRFKTGMFGTERVIFPLAGQRNLFVQVDAASLADPRTSARTEFAGRLLTFSDLGARFRVIREYLTRSMAMPVSGDTYLLVADDPPATHAWSVLFAVFCAGIVAFNVWLFSRWFRPIR